MIIMFIYLVAIVVFKTFTYKTINPYILISKQIVTCTEIA